ncbi:MAG: gfo/Idh/MocA family oxidoreductase [Paenibacillus sp.]|nr:gfo/Idh/MocA family oxidoreductase [Paenibacillus sp.]
MAYRVALVGCGAIADRHLDALKYLNEKGRLEAVAAADVNEARLQAAARRYGSHLRHYADYKQMIKDEKPDIAIITLPHHLHAEAACFAAAAGCHVLLEKPMALNVQECDRIMEHARRRNATLLVGHTLRYSAPIRQARKIIQEGGLGQLIMVHDARHTDYFAEGRPEWFFAKAMSGGGIAFNLGSHSIDKAIWLAGSPVASVAASMTFHGDRGDVEGSVMASLRLRNGVTAAIVQSGYKGASANYTELLFTAGSLRLESGGMLYRSQGGAYELVELPGDDDPFVLQLEDLMSAIESGTALACTMEEATHVVEVLEGMYRSHRSGREETIGLGPDRFARREAFAFAAIPPARLSARGAWADIRDGAELAIAHYRWTPEHHGPKARAALSYTSDELQICLRAYETDPLTRFTAHNDPVYKDSCLEFFLQPSPEEDARYLNLELNAAGTLLIGIGAARQNRLYLRHEELPPLHIRASKNQRDPLTGETYWEVRFRLSLTWLASLFPTFRPRPGAKMRGNLYKCGDETSYPHYGSWSPVRADAPDFHRSEDFGWLVLDEQGSEPTF